MVVILFAIPADINGVYVNFVTGASGTSGAGTAGWDFSAYASGGTLRFYSSAGAANTTQYVGTGTTISLLAAGTMIDASSALSPAGVVLHGDDHRPERIPGHAHRILLPE